MDFTTFVRKPFTIEAVRITKENIADVAKEVGELCEMDDGSLYIQVNRRGINIDRVFVGYWMTKLGNRVHCYSNKIFRQEFIELTGDIEAWIRFLNHEEEGANATT